MVGRLLPALALLRFDEGRPVAREVAAPPVEIVTGEVEIKAAFEKRFVKARAVLKETGDDSTGAVAVEYFFGEGVTGEDLPKKFVFVLGGVFGREKVTVRLTVLFGGQS